MCIKMEGEKSGPRESLWVENLSPSNKNVLQDCTTVTAVVRKQEVG